jgi:hypothetical protein
MTTFYLKTPEAQAKRQAFKTSAHERIMAIKNAPKVARLSKPAKVSNSTPRVPFKGAGKK